MQDINIPYQSSGKINRLKYDEGTFVFKSHPMITPLYPYTLCFITCPILNFTCEGLGDLGVGDPAKNPLGSLNCITSLAAHSPVSVIPLVLSGPVIILLISNNQLFHCSMLMNFLIVLPTPTTSLKWKINTYQLLVDSKKPVACRSNRM